MAGTNWMLARHGECNSLEQHQSTRIVERISGKVASGGLFTRNQSEDADTTRQHDTLQHEG